jgi:toxin YhaV
VKGLVIQGWRLFAHPLLLDQLDKLATAVANAKAKTPDTWQSTANAKLLAALRQLIFETVPADPTRNEYRQGETLGKDRKHWFRAKFGNGRFRLFFRYSSKDKAIIYAWVNDETTLRAYGSKTDAYAVFCKMLDHGHPPDTWETLLKEANTSGAQEHLQSARPDHPEESSTE